MAGGSTSQKYRESMSAWLAHPGATKERPLAAINCIRTVRWGGDTVLQEATSDSSINHHEWQSEI